MNVLMIERTVKIEGRPAVLREYRLPSDYVPPPDVNIPNGTTSIYEMLFTDASNGQVIRYHNPNVTSDCTEKKARRRAPFLGPHFEDHELSLTDFEGMPEEHTIGTARDLAKELGIYRTVEYWSRQPTISLDSFFEMQSEQVSSRRAYGLHKKVEVTPVRQLGLGLSETAIEYLFMGGFRAYNYVGNDHRRNRFKREFEEAVAAARNMVLGISTEAGMGAPFYIECVQRESSIILFDVPHIRKPS